MATEVQIAGTGTTDSSVGTLAWRNPSNITADDGSVTDDWFAKSGTGLIYSEYLKSTNFGFSIPDGATIDGITVEFKDFATNNAGYTKDWSVKLVKGGTVQGNDKADQALLSGDKTYGGSSDLWGITLSSSDVNASDFGVVFQSQENTVDFNMVMEWDYCQITAHYTEVATNTGAFFQLF